MVEEVYIGEPIETFETFGILRKYFDLPPRTRKNALDWGTLLIGEWGMYEAYDPVAYITDSVHQWLRMKLGK